MTAIVNVQHSTQAATIIGRDVVGYRNTGTGNQLWDFIRPIEDPKAAVIANIGGTFASVQNKVQFAPVISSRDPYLWASVGTEEPFQIVTTDGDKAYAWRLTSDKEDAPIVLQLLPYSGEDSLWVHKSK